MNNAEIAKMIKEKVEKTCIDMEYRFDNPDDRSVFIERIAKFYIQAMKDGLADIYRIPYIIITGFPNDKAIHIHFSKDENGEYSYETKEVKGTFEQY